MIRVTIHLDVQRSNKKYKASNINTNSCWFYYNHVMQTTIRWIWTLLIMQNAKTKKKQTEKQKNIKKTDSV